MDPEQKLANEHLRAAASARKLLANRDFLRVWDWLHEDLGAKYASINPADLHNPQLDGISKALMMARSDGAKDVFTAFDTLTQWSDADAQQTVITEEKEEDDEHE